VCSTLKKDKDGQIHRFDVSTAQVVKCLQVQYAVMHNHVVQLVGGRANRGCRRRGYAPVVEGGFACDGTGR